MGDGGGRSAGGAGHRLESQGSWLPTAPGPPAGHGLGASVEGQRRRWGGAFVTGSRVPGPGPPSSALYSPPPAGPPRVCPQAPLPPRWPCPCQPGSARWASPPWVPPTPPGTASCLRDGEAPRGAAGDARAERHLLPTPTPRGSPAVVPTGSEVTHLGPAASPLSGAEAVICGELSGGPRLGQGWAPSSCGHFDDVGGVDPVVSTVVGKQ